MNSILEALRKSSQAPEGETPPSKANVLFEKSPYDSASVYWERQRYAQERGMRRIVRLALMLGAASMLIAIGLAAYVLMGMNAPEADDAPAGGGLAMVQPTSAAQPPASFDVLPSQYAPVIQPSLALEPPPRDTRPEAAPLETDELAIVDPDATPLPLDLDDPPLPVVTPLAAQAPRLPSYRLQGIIWDEQRPMAMIDGRAVRVGDPIGQARVVRIQREAVVLEIDGETLTLK